MTILVDADGVLENLTYELPALLNEKYGFDVKFEDIRGWGFADSFLELTQEQIASAELEELLYDRIRPILGAPEYLKRLMDDGHNVYVLTNTPYEAVSLKMKKVMERFFPFLPWSNYIITSNKQMIRGDFLIDDGIHNLVGGDYKKLLFDAPCNWDYDAEANGMIRVFSWEDIYRIITKESQEKKESRKSIRMNAIYNTDILIPLETSENRPTSEVRRYTCKLAQELTEQIMPEIEEDDKVLFVFVLRGAMLMYPPFAERFASSSFTFITEGTFTPLDCKDYDKVIIVDTVVDTGKTVTMTKKLLMDSGISAKRWFCVCVFAKASVKPTIAASFDRFFCLVFPEELSRWIDAGKYAACGDGAQITQG